MDPEADSDEDSQAQTLPFSSPNVTASPHSSEENDVRGKTPPSSETWSVFVGSLNSRQLPSSIQNHHLQQHFKDFESSIVQASIVVDRETKQSKGCGFVVFRSKEAAQEAIDKLHGSQLHGCTLKLEFARKKGSRNSESGMGLQRSRKGITSSTPFSSTQRKGQAQLQEHVSSTPTRSSNVSQQSPTVFQTSATKNYSALPSPHSLPQSVIPPSNSIAVSNLSPAISEEEISSLCGGSITSISIQPTGPNSNKAEIRFSSPKEAQEAIARMNGKEFLGQTLSATFIQPSQSQLQPQMQSQTYRQEFMYPVKITHISPTTDEALLVQQFQNAGEIISHRFPPSSGNRYALINFKQENEASRAEQMFHGKTIDGWKINVKKREPQVLRKGEQPSQQCNQVPGQRADMNLQALPTSDVFQEVVKLSPEQCNLLTTIKAGSSLYQELSRPFKANPNVNIDLLLEDFAVRFVGKQDAVKSAHDHFLTQLQCYIPLEQNVTTALLSIFPTLHTTVLKNHSVTLSGFGEGSTILKLDGHTSDIGKARNYIDTIIVQFQQTSVTPQISLTATLLTSARKRFRMQNIAAYIVVSEGCSDVTVCSFSPDNHKKAVEIVRGNLVMKFVPFQTSEVLEQHSQLQKVEDEHSVMVEVNETEKKVYIKGYVYHDVQSAFDSMRSFVSKLSVQFSSIACGPEQMQYLQHKLRFPNEATQHILESLPAKIVTEEKKVPYLRGSPKDIEKTQKEIVEGPLLHGLRYQSFHFQVRHKFLSQIEQHVLQPVRKKCPDFIYVIRDRDSKRQQGRKASIKDEEATFIVTIMSQDSAVFEEAAMAMDKIKPCSKCLIKPVKAIECVQERTSESDIEQRYRVRIVVPKQSNKIVIFGLTEDEATQCLTELSEYIDSTVVIKKFIPLNSHEAKYLQDKKRVEFQELRRKCTSLKVVDKRKQEETDTVLIQVEGTVQQVRSVKQDVNEMIGDSFTVQSFSVACKRKFSRMWQKRWNDIKKEKEQSYDIIIQFSKRDAANASDHDKPVEYEFTVFGTDHDGASEVKEMICNQDNGQLTEEKRLQLPPEAIKALFKGLSEKDLHVHDQYTVNMFIDSKRNQVILTAPKECCDDLEAAEEEIQKYIGNQAFIGKEIFINDPVISLILQSKTKSFSHLTVANNLAKPFGVTVHCLRKPRCGLVLRGTPESISQVEPIIVQQVITVIQSTLGEVKVSVDPNLRAYLSTPEFTHFSAKLRNDLCVMTTLPVLTKPNQVLKSMFLQATSTASCIKLDICKGNLVNERVDAIVNAANEDLCHAGGVARTIVEAGGDAIQQESNQYIQTKGKLKPGSVVCLSAGNLLCKRVIHAVGPRWMDGNSGEEQALYLTVFNALIAAQGEGLGSIAIPAIGTGVFGVPYDVCVRASLKAVQDFSQKNPSSCITNVRFVLLQQKLADLFCDGADSNVPQGCAVKVEQHQYRPPSMPLSYEYTWHWQDDCGSYTPYSVHLNAKLNNEFKHNPQGHLRFTLTKTGNAYCVNFNSMTQTNENTKHQRSVMKVPVTSDSSRQSVQWFFTDDSAKLAAYTPQDSNAIERMFIAGKPSPLTICGRTYCFDFNKMCQVNVDTGYMRKIVRKTSADQTRTPNTDLPSKPAEQAKKSVVTLRGPQTNLPQAKSKLEEKLKAAVKSNDVYFPAGLEKTITKILQQQYVSFEIHSVDQVTMKEGKKFQKLVSFRGLAHAVHLATSAIQDEIINYQASAAEGSEVEVPTDWQPQTANLELFPLARNSMEWSKVEAHFRATLPNQHIQQITRIQNKWLWEKYAQHKKRLAYKNNGAVNEKELFHGTRHNDPKWIYEGEDGFDMRFSAQGMWGLANYFAVNASYSYNYSYCLSNGCREMFLVKVLTGDSYQCNSDSSLRLPPEKSGGASGSLQFAKTRYDTVTGVTAGSQVYMTYDNDKAYPAYLIQYK